MNMMFSEDFFYNGFTISVTTHEQGHDICAYSY